MILQGITNNLSAYAPNYVTMDYACQYVRATRTSRLLSATYDPAFGQVTVSLSGYADLETSFYVFAGADDAISPTSSVVPAFSGSVTDAFAMFGTRPAPPAIVEGPSSLTNPLGASATFTVSAVGPLPLAYQWLQGLTPLTDGGNISGAASGSLTLTNLTATNAGTYTVVVTNLAGSVTSAPVTLTVVNPPQFTSVAWLADSTLQLSCEVVSNLNYRIDVSTDLVNWTVLTNLSGPSGPLQLVDPAAANFPRRYYRAVWVP